MVPAWQTLKSLRPPRTDRIRGGQRLDVVRYDAGQPLKSVVAVVDDRIEAYERDHEPR
jgi:HTH-type transcriptional regulator / antitoxin HigA